MLALVLVGCEKGSSSEEKLYTSTKLRAKPENSRYLDLDNCHRDRDCCKEHPGDCASATVDVTPSIMSSLDDLADDSDGSSQSTDEIFTYLESHQEELNLSGNLLSQLDDQEVLTMDKFDNGTYDYYPFAGDSANQIYILAVKE